VTALDADLPGAATSDSSVVADASKDIADEPTLEDAGGSIDLDALVDRTGADVSADNDPAVGPDSFGPDTAVGAEPGSRGDAVPAASDANLEDAYLQDAGRSDGRAPLSWAGFGLVQDRHMARSPRIALGRAGTAVAAWQKGETVVMASRYGGPSGWAEPEVIDVGGPTALAGVAFAGDLPLVLWSSWDEHRNGVWASRTSPSGWRPPVRITEGGTYAPRLAANRSGAAVAVWRGVASIGTTFAYASMMAVSGVWSEPVKISRGDTNVEYARVALDDGSRAIVVWDEDDGSKRSVWASQHENGQWTTPRSLAENAQTIPLYPNVVLNERGQGAVTWVEQHEPGRQRFKWLPFEPPFVVGEVSEVSERAEISHDLPLPMGIDGAGNAVVAWGELDRLGAVRLFARRHVRASGWDRVEPIDTMRGGAVPMPHILDLAMGERGAAFVVWSQRRNGLVDLWSIGYTPDSGWGESTLVEAREDYGIIEPHVTVSPDGTAGAIWCYEGEFSIWSNFGHASQ
jgi:hypothetical protein